MSAVADPIGILAQARSDCVVGAKPSPRRPCFAWPDRRSIASTARRNRVHGGLSRPLEKTALARGFTCRQCRMHGRMVRGCPSAQPRLPMRGRRDERGRAAGQPPLSPNPARGFPAQAGCSACTKARSGPAIQTAARANSRFASTAGLLGSAERCSGACARGR